MTLEEIKRYLLLNKIVTLTGCWLIDNRKSNTYVTLNGSYIHKWSNLIFNNISLDKMTLHKCDNPPCWNPEHLFEGTQSDNRMDSILKGRSKRKWGNSLLEQQKTHCAQGHEYTKENTRKYAGKRICKECQKIKDKERNKGRITIKGIRLRTTQLVKRGLL